MFAPRTHPTHGGNQGVRDAIATAADAQADSAISLGGVEDALDESATSLGGVGEGSAVGDLFDVNSSEFWEHWVDAGGDMDSYVKDSLPTNGLVGALLLTVTYPYILDPPGNLGADHGAEAAAFIILMTLATLINFVMVIMTIVIYTQYCCCVNDASRLRFTGHFGYLIPVLVFLILAEVVILAAATGVAIWANSPPEAFYVTVSMFAVMFIATAGLVIWLPMWNQKYNYVDEVAAVAKEKKRQQKKVTKEVTKEVTKNCPQVGLVGLHESPHKSLHKLISLEDVLKENNPVREEQHAQGRTSSNSSISSSSIR